MKCNSVDQVQTFAQTNNLFLLRQHEFLAGQFRVYILVSCNSTLAGMLNAGTAVDLIMPNFTRAFDSSLVSWFSVLLNGRKHFVILSSSSSQVYYVPLGLVQ